MDMITHICALVSFFSNWALARFEIRYPTRFCLIAALFLLGSGKLAGDESKQNAGPLQVDVSFLIVDLKYNRERGAQICEIQHGVHSAFRGHRMLFEGHDLIAYKMVDHLSGFFEKSWAAINSFADPTIKELLLENSRWEQVFNFADLQKKTDFLINASLPVSDSSDIISYHGFAFMSPSSKLDRDHFRLSYPGVILIDNAFYNLANDKHKTTDLLMGHPVTEQHKPKWGIYQKNEVDLADRINSEIESDLLVIKPKGEFLGRGVIILRKEDLKDVLEYICNSKNRRSPHEDDAYIYWRQNKAADFLVEEFIEVEPIPVPHLKGRLYSPTLRLAYLLFYNNGQIETDCLGGYYTLPKIPVNEEGTLNERFKSYIALPHFAKADPAIIEDASLQMNEVLKIVYQKLLGIDH